ncbi:MAG: hypothetical protein Q4D41_02890 [Prevotellaceae bacterium]|nr:hypothetical protein [Prevotellaceae bacterium]
MGNPKRLRLVFLAVFAAILTACGEDGELAVPLPQDVSEEYLEECVSGKGWIEVVSHEIKSNGILDKRDYWQLPDVGSPVSFYFQNDSITIFHAIGTYQVNGYNTEKFTYDNVLHSLKNGEEEIFKILSVTPDEIRLVKYQELNGDGEKIYIYSVYRKMTDNELAECKQSHPYNLATFNDEYPLLPEQMQITLNDFAQKVVGHGWKCTEVHELETDNRYKANDIVNSAKRFSLDNIYISADSLITLPTAKSYVSSLINKTKYNYRANGYYISTESGSGLRILSVSSNEMKVIYNAGNENEKSAERLFCIYKRMTADELAGTGESLTEEGS